MIQCLLTLLALALAPAFASENEQPYMPPSPQQSPGVVLPVAPQTVTISANKYDDLLATEKRGRTAKRFNCGAAVVSSALFLVNWGISAWYYSHGDKENGSAFAGLGIGCLYSVITSAVSIELGPV